MDEYVTRFTSLLNYVPYMQEEKAKIQCFISSLPNFMKENLDFDYPKTKDDAVWKAYICYQQMKQKNEGSKGSLNKKGISLIPNKHSRFVGGRNVQQKSLSKFLARNQPKASYS